MDMQNFNSFFPDMEELPQFPIFALERKKLRDGILVRSPNWLGDAVMTFPALRQLKLMLPQECGLMVLCPAGLAPLFRTLDCVDKVFPLKDAHAFMSRKEREEVREHRPGIAVFFNNSLRDVLSLQGCGIHQMYGAAARFRSIFLKRSYQFAKRQDFILNHPHQALKYLAMVQASGAPEWDGTMPVMTPDPLHPPCDHVRNILEREGELLLLAPGAAYGDAKRLDGEKFRAVAEAWLKEGGFVAAVGSKNESPQTADALAGLPEQNVYDLAGRTNLEELICLIQRSKCCLANDSGVMHLAAAAGASGVAVFGSTDPVATGPLSRKWKVLYQQQKCSPCFKRSCPRGDRRCFAAVSTEEILEAVKEIRSKA